VNAGQPPDSPDTQGSDGRESQLPGGGDTTLPDHSPAADQHMIGPYRILETLGEGGMGVVYLAEQRTPVQRKIALKIVKLGLDSREVVARFAAERQALAMMNHPGIARIFDGGMTETGRPYFVMEYVPGLPLTEYCDRHHLSTRERLELLAAVCRAVQHAHQKGIVHRDLKPTNILVSVQEGRPVPKIIDFGVAKAVDHRLTPSTLFTVRGQLIGTPIYMSPEQAEMSGIDIDTTSDVYSLGVILYELLTGEPPLKPAVLQQAGLAEIQRLVREVDPPRPSLRISSLGAAASRAADHRRRVPQTWYREIRGDLDWITMRALEKDRTHRYQSASELAADIERHLADEPVSAGPPGARYRLRKFVRRHRGPVLAAAAVVSALVVGLVASWALYLQAEDARRQAEYNSYVASILLAQISLQDNDVLAARRFLTGCPENLRGWEWHHLDYRSDASVHRYAIANPARGGILVAPDGVICALADGAGIIRFIELATGAERGRCDVGYTGELFWTFSPRGDRLATWGAGGETQHYPIQVWSVPDGRLIAEPDAQDRAESPTECLFSHDGQMLYCSEIATHTIDAGGVAVTTDLHGWQLPLTEPVFSVRDTFALRLLDVSPAGDLIASASLHDIVAIHDAHDGRQLATFPDCQAIAARFVPDGRRLVTGGVDGSIQVRDIATATVVQSLEGHAGHVRELAIGADGRLLLSHGEDDLVRVHDLFTGKLFAEYPVSNEPNWYEFAPDGFHLLSRPDRQLPDGVFVRRWDPTRSPARELEGDGGSWLAFSPDGRTLAGGSRSRFIDARGTSYDAAVRLWDVTAGFLRRVLRGHTSGIKWCGFDVTGSRLFSASWDETLHVWDTATGTCLQALPTAKNTVVDPWGKLAAARTEEAIVVIALATGDTVTVLPCASMAGGGMAFDPKGQFLAAALGWGYRLWRLPEGELLVDRGSPDVSTRCVAFGCDGRTIALGGWHGSVCVSEARTGKTLAAGQGNSGHISALAFHPDGARLAVAGTGLVIWDVIQCRPLLEVSDLSFDSVTFSPDGVVLAASTVSWQESPDAKPVMLWRMTPSPIGAAELKDGFLARPLANGLVDSLFAVHVLLDPVLESIESQTTRSRHVRAAAREIAQVRGGDPETLSAHSLALARPPAGTRADFLQARELAVAACRLNPIHPLFAKALGLAHYRLADYAEALPVLARADSLSTPFVSQSGHPETVAFLAMTHARLGNADQAAAALARMRQLLNQPAYAKDMALAALAREAEESVVRSVDH